jgi:hypothetical protein
VAETLAQVRFAQNGYHFAFEAGDVEVSTANDVHERPNDDGPVCRELGEFMTVSIRARVPRADFQWVKTEQEG